MSTNKPRRVAIVAAQRTPFARSGTAYASLSNQTMLTDTLRALVERCHLEGERLGQVVGGAVMKHSSDWNLVRESVLGSGLDPATPACDLQMACGTSLEAASVIANKIALGQIECGIACGSDTTSDAPVEVSRGLQRTLMDINAARTNSARLMAGVKLLDPRKLLPKLPANAEPRTGKSMGQHAEITAQRLGIDREAQDKLALASHQKLAKAYDRGFFDDLVVPYHGLKQDNNLRRDTSLERLASLGPVFERKGGSITAGNASPLTDGASAVLLASESWAKKRGLPILAYLVDVEVSAVDFIDEREGLLLAPAYAIPRMLTRRGLKLQDFDFYEIHEAFAAVVLSTLAVWESKDFCIKRLGLEGPLGSIDKRKLNVVGSSVAAGHPFAATGARLLGTLAKLLSEKQGGGRGLISICAAGGQGIAAILES